MARLLFVFLLLCPALAVPETVREATRPCRVERFDHAYAHCVEHIAAQRYQSMEARIAATLSSLQAPTQPELAALEARYAAAQSAWREAVLQGCAGAFPDDLRAHADCQLAAVLDREAQVALSLDRVADDLGGALAYDIPVPDAVDVFIPLPGVPNGPRQRIRVPLVVPVQP